MYFFLNVVFFHWLLLSLQSVWLLSVLLFSSQHPSPGPLSLSPLLSPLPLISLPPSIPGDESDSRSHLLPGKSSPALLPSSFFCLQHIPRSSSSPPKPGLSNNLKLSSFSPSSSQQSGRRCVFRLLNSLSPSPGSVSPGFSSLFK